MATKPTQKKPLGPNPADVNKKVSDGLGHTDISKKGDLRESGTTLPPLVKKGK